MNNRNIEVCENIHYIGVNDRRTALFENLWPIPWGISYNAYLIRDEHHVLVDTVEAGHAGQFLEQVRGVVGDEPIDYLVLNHVEPDHSGSLNEVLAAYPQITVVGNEKTRGLITRFYGFDGRFLLVKENDVLSLGKKSLRFIMTPMVHWPETMMTLEEDTHTLFTGDAFGSFGTLDGAIFDDEMDASFYQGEMRRYYANIVGKYSGMVQKALKKLGGVTLNHICPTHGPIWREDPQRVISWYDAWSKQTVDPGVVIVFGSMYGHTESMADHLARMLVEEGVRKVRVFDASKTHMSYILAEIWRYQGLMLGSCAYNTGMLPTMDALTRKLASSGLANRVLGIFGNYSWSGGGVKSLETFAEEMGWESVGSSIEAQSVTIDTDEERLREMAKRMARKLRG